MIENEGSPRLKPGVSSRSTGEQAKDTEPLLTGNQANTYDAKPCIHKLESCAVNATHLAQTFTVERIHRILRIRAWLSINKFEDRPGHSHHKNPQHPNFLDPINLYVQYHLGYKVINTSNYR